MAGHPLRPATHRRLGEPLPHQLANGTQVHPKAVIPLVEPRCLSSTTSGISTPFEVLSRALGQVTYALLTRPPLGLLASIRRLPHANPARLACIRHAASVRPEPGSNSPLKSILKCLSTLAPTSSKSCKLKSQGFSLFVYCLVVKERVASANRRIGATLYNLSCPEFLGNPLNS